MPVIEFEGQQIECEPGDNLRKTLMKHNLSPYNGKAAIFNCRGLGTCGTCAVKLEGAVSEMATREKARLSLPPHSATSGLRLSCQVKVLGDVKVEKCDGFFGQKVAAHKT